MNVSLRFFFFFCYWIWFWKAGWRSIALNIEKWPKITIQWFYFYSNQICSMRRIKPSKCIQTFPFVNHFDWQFYHPHPPLLIRSKPDNILHFGFFYNSISMINAPHFDVYWATLLSHMILLPNIFNKFQLRKIRRMGNGKILWNGAAFYRNLLSVFFCIVLILILFCLVWAVTIIIVNGSYCLHRWHNKFSFKWLFGITSLSKRKRTWLLRLLHLWLL